MKRVGFVSLGIAGYRKTSRMMALPIAPTPDVTGISTSRPCCDLFLSFRHLSGELVAGTRTVDSTPRMSATSKPGIVNSLWALYVALRDLTRIVALCVRNQHKDPVRYIALLCP